MTRSEVISHVIHRWRNGPDDFCARVVMLRLIAMGYPCTRRDVLDIVKAYVRMQNENSTYKTKA